MQPQAAFISRDLIVPADPFLDDVRDAQNVPFLPQAIEGLKKLQAKGMLLILLLNAPQISKGFLTPGNLALIHQILISRLSHKGVEIHVIKHCPHTAEMGCLCRMPKPGLMEWCKTRYKLDLPNCLAVGRYEDKTVIEAGRRAGIQSLIAFSSWEVFDPEHCESVAPDNPGG